MLISKFGGDDISEKIEMYEDLIGKALPEQLSAFLEKYNGGQTPNTRFNCNGVSSDVKAFYGMGKVLYSFDEVKVLDDKGETYLPFATDSYGNEMIISIKFGEVFFRNHENGKLYKIADDLKHFIASCNSESINPSSLKSVEEREQELIKKGRGAVITETLRDMWRAEIAKYSSMCQEEVVF